MNRLMDVYTVVKKAGTEVRFAPLRMFVILSTAIGSYALAKADSLELRGQFPEPFDYFNHATNAGGSLGFSYYYGTIAAMNYLRFANRPTAAKARAVGIGVGAGVVLAANIIWETKTGARIVHDTSTTEDLRDLAWGALGTAVGAAAIQVRSTEAGVTPAEVSPDPQQPEVITGAPQQPGSGLDATITARQPSPDDWYA